MRGRPASRGRRRLPGRRRAFRRRFFAGHTGPGEYGSLADLPPIPASFDTPDDDAQQGDAPLAATEDTP
jgi:hypothetical protein